MTPKKYKVVLQGTFEVEVEATSEEEASEKAEIEALFPTFFNDYWIQSVEELV